MRQDSRRGERCGKNTGEMEEKENSREEDMENSRSAEIPLRADRAAGGGGSCRREPRPLAPGCTWRLAIWAASKLALFLTRIVRTSSVLHLYGSPCVAYNATHQ